MKYGIFGGTFNPVHHGHLINARYVLERYGLDKILFVPSKIPVHKNLEGGISADDRYEMLRLATMNNVNFSVSRIELDSEQPSFTIYTVENLQREHPACQFTLVMGDDAFNEINTWKDYKRLLSNIAVIVMTRESLRDWPDIDGEKVNVQFCRNPIIEISSSCIRKRIRDGKSIRYLVPKEVEDYIICRELYNRE